MAEVFKAKSFGVEGFEKLIAIKRILPNIAEDEDFITMFIDEAKIAVQLNHANIAQIFDLGKIDDSYFIALEFIQGKDLRTIWDRHKRRGLRMPIPMSAYVVTRVCEGLDYAHRKKDAAGQELNIVHRDVSPQNVLLSYEGEVKIIDFGIAKAANKASKTQAGILKGKFGYMSPEQVRGLPLDRRSDIFALGIILYELLTGERLFVGESDFSTLEKVRNVEILPPTTYNRNIPDTLEKIVLKALSKDPDDRFQSSYDMQEELQRFLILSKSNFARKDLSGYMKRAFKSDIQRELERHKKHEEMIEETDVGADADDEPTELPTSRVPPLVSQQATLEHDIPPSNQILSPQDSGSLGAIPTIAGPDDDDDDEDCETVVWDPREDLSDAGPINTSSTEMPTARPQPPPIGGPPSRKPPPRIKQQPPSSKPPPTKPDRPVAPYFDDVSFDTQTDETPNALSPFSLSDDPYSTGEATLAEENPIRKKRSPLNMVIAVLAVIAVGVFGFAVFKYLQQQGMFGGSATLIIQSTPANTQLWLDGQQVKNRVENVKPGAHLLEAKADNYQAFKEEIHIAAGEEVPIAISLKFIPAIIEINITPPDAIVKMDGKQVGDKSPVLLEDVLPGVEHTFVFEHAKYVNQTEKWTLKPRESINKKIVMVEASFDLDIDRIPSGAKIVLDGNRKGQAPKVIKGLKATKQYQLNLQRKDYQPWSGTIFFDGSAVKVVRPRLEPLSETAPTPRKINEKHASPGHTPKPKPKIKPKPKVKPKTKIKPKSKIKPKTKTSDSVNMGTLRLNSTPWGKVFIDGKDVNQNTPLPNYKLSQGVHTITIEFANGGKKTVIVDIFSGQVTKKIVKK